MSIYYSFFQHLGIAHPPGYPAFVLLSSIFARLPLISVTLRENYLLELNWNPSIGWKMTQLSTFCGACTAWLIFESTLLTISLINNSELLTSVNSLVAGIVAISYAFMPLVWEYSVSAEVFALNNVLCAIVLYCSLKAIAFLFSENSSNSSVFCKQFIPVYFGAFFSGLAFTNQHTSLLHVSFLILVVMGALFYKVSLNSAVLVITIAGLCCLIGFTPYLHLYFAAKIPHPGSWGDTSSIFGLFRHISRSEYGTFRLGFIEGSENMWERIFRYAVFTNEQMLFLPTIAFLGFAFSSAVHYLSTPSKNQHNRTKFQSPIQKSRSGNNTKKIQNSSTALQVVDEIEKCGSNDSTLLKFMVFLILLGSFLWYTFIWHGVFSNLPLSNPMAFGVHSRFWMQPNIVLSVLLGYLLSNSAATLWLSFGYKDANFVLVCSVVFLYAAAIITARWDMASRSDSLSWTMHKHGENILRNIPNDSILLTHTDLDLNPTRFLQFCESAYVTKSVHQISLQMMPYPWFETQQVPIYSSHGIVFPNSQFEGVSTSRLSQGNARLITQFLNANLRKQGRVKNSLMRSSGMRPIFLDMQAVNEAEIGSMGEWRGFILVPYGLEYLVVPPFYFVNNTSHPPTMLSVFKIASRYHHQSWNALQQVKANFPAINNYFHTKFPPGTWESAAMNVFYDAHYQTGLFYLTWVLDESSQISVDSLGIILDRLLASVLLLQEAWDAGSKYQTFSSSLRDLQRNTALAYMRLQGILSVFYKIQSKIQGSILSQLDQAEDINDFVAEGSALYSPSEKDSYRFLVQLNVREIVINSQESAVGQLWLHKSVQSLEAFVRDYPRDENVAVFAAAAKSAKALLTH